MTRRRALLLVALAALATGSALACEEPPAPPSPAPHAAAEAETRAAQTAREAAQELGRTLKTRLLAAMAEGGPTRAVEICRGEARAIADRVAEARGARVGRASLRLRNPANAGPPWVRAWLEAQGERAAEGVAPSTSVEGDRARFVAPIAVEGPCLACHGAPEALAPEVRALLAEGYPADRATGYAVGDLRGAVWAEVAIVR